MGVLCQVEGGFFFRVKKAYEVDLSLRGSGVGIGERSRAVLETARDGWPGPRRSGIRNSPAGPIAVSYTHLTLPMKRIV